MKFREADIPTLTGREEGYYLENKFIIQNGKSPCKVWFYVTARALVYWAKNILQKPSIRSQDALEEFSRLYVKRFQTIFEQILERLIRQYKGFPSPIHLTEEINFTFDIGEYGAMCENYSKDFKSIIVALNIGHIILPDEEILGSISHELYHIASQLHEAEAATRKSITRWQNKLNRAINENKIVLERGIQALVQYFENNGLDEHYTEKEIKEITEEFYRYSGERFWNLIADSALCIIAMELKDMDYVYFSIGRDQERMPILKSKLGKFNLAINHLLNSKSKDMNKALFLSTLKILQFIKCFDSMPYESVAYAMEGSAGRKKIGLFGAIFKRKNEAAKVIYEFKGMIKANCDENVIRGFLRFYESYLGIIKAQLTHDIPLGTDVQKQIHNPQTTEMAKLSYKILNEEFYKLFMPIKKHSR